MLINEKLILVDELFENKEALLKHLSQKAFQLGKIKSEEEYLTCVEEREKSFSTYVGNGIAIPHGKSDAVNEAMVMCAKLKKPILWGDDVDELVDLVFLLGVPSSNTDNLHLKILAELSRKLMDDEFTSNLREAKTSEEVFAILSNVL